MMSKTIVVMAGVVEDGGGGGGARWWHQCWRRKIRGLGLVVLFW